MLRLWCFTPYTGLRDLDSNLGPYPYDSLKKWISLTNHISEALVLRYIIAFDHFANIYIVLFLFQCCHRIQPLNGKISSVTQVKCEEQPRSTASTFQRGAKESDSCPPVSAQQSDCCGCSQITPGGLFAGVGEFPPTQKEAAASTSQVTLNYSTDAMLRCAVNPLLRGMGRDYQSG